MPHPDSPAAFLFDYQFQLPRLDMLERVEMVYRAVRAAPMLVPGELYRATGQELHEMVKGLVPSLLMMVAVMAVSAGVGAAAGAALGALFFGWVRCPEPPQEQRSALIWV